jgi:hypothetical protein
MCLPPRARRVLTWPLLRCHAGTAGCVLQHPAASADAPPPPRALLRRQLPGVPGVPTKCLGSGLSTVEAASLCSDFRKRCSMCSSMLMPPFLQQAAQGGGAGGGGRVSTCSCGGGQAGKRACSARLGGRRAPGTAATAAAAALPEPAR